MNTTLYLLVFDTNKVLNNKNCEYLGIPEGSTFEDLRVSGEPYNGYFKNKDGKPVWVLPFYFDSELELDLNSSYYIVLTKQQLIDYNFDNEM